MVSGMIWSWRESISKLGFGVWFSMKESAKHMPRPLDFSLWMRVLLVVSGRIVFLKTFGFCELGFVLNRAINGMDLVDSILRMFAATFPTRARTLGGICLLQRLSLLENLNHVVKVMMAKDFITSLRCCFLWDDFLAALAASMLDTEGMGSRLVKQLLAKQDCFVRMPTGGGIKFYVTREWDKPSCKLLYVTPERICLGTPAFLEILKYLHLKPVGNMISGPDLQEIRMSKSRISRLSLCMALTATATHSVREDILKTLRIPRGLS
ncbi:hypothetical protein NC652_012505 [Populus alba x Populus x berolinensis]|nr:hypothetical protein NC652_012505 [Populus alba x Populus x berolinensis]